MAVKHPKFISCQQLINASINNPPLKKYAKGEGVRLVQEALIQLMGIDLPLSTLPDGTLDGDFGTETKNAVIAFQLIHELDDDGRVGTDTLGKIEEELFKNKPKPPVPTPPPPPPEPTNIPSLIVNALTFPPIKMGTVWFDVTRCFDYVLDGCAIAPFIFPLLRSYFNKMRIRTRHDPHLDTAGEYDSVNDVLILKSLGADLKNRSLIVHECIHAELDRAQAGQVTVAHSEGLAYIAQCLYYQLYNTDNTELHGETNTGSIFEYANVIARKVNAHHTTRFVEGFKPETYRVSTQDANDLLQAINTSERYDGSLGQFGDFNGIPDEHGDL